MENFFDKIKVQAVIGFIIILGGLAIITFTNVNDADRIGVFSLMNFVMGYYFGSSKGSKEKDDTINDLSRKK